MSKKFNNPNLLTKERLKKELESNGIQLPRGEHKKEIYVRLYREHLSPEGGLTSANGEFSSDDDMDFGESPQNRQIVHRGVRSVRQTAPKDVVSADIVSMTDEELRVELRTLGSPVGPIMPSTRQLYERKLARIRDNTQTSGKLTNFTMRSEFSDDDVDENVGDETPPDEFFFPTDEKNGEKNYGETFTKNFQNKSSKKETTRGFSASSSRNVERSSTFDRKTTNKVRTKKGDKFEEESWSTATNNEDDDTSLQLPKGLPSHLQNALTASSPFKTRTLATPTKGERVTPQSISTPTRRGGKQGQPASKNVSAKTGAKVKDRETASKRKTSTTWQWILFVIVLVLYVLAIAMFLVYNLEKTPVF